MKYDLTGQKFNYLTVRKLNGKDSRGNYVWECICECGNARNVNSTRLRQGVTKSCGCKNFTSPHGNRKSTAVDTSINALWNRHIQSSKTKGRSWTLTKEEFKSLVFSSCYYCGDEPNQSYNVFITKEGKYRKGIKDWADGGNIFYNGIDRKDNSKGYEKENCLSCCFVCNRAKLTMDYEEFLKWIKRLVNKWHV